MIYSGKSDIGLKRSSNQDSFNITELSDGCLLATVCDGMGGANGGNIASDVACKTYTECILSDYSGDDQSTADIMSNAVSKANEKVYGMAQNDDSLSGMGTTLVSAIISPDGKADIINVGDSKLFAVTENCMKQITHDHSYVQYLVDMGQITVKEAKNASIRNIIIRSVGNEAETRPDLFSFTMTPDTTILLCSDGLTGCASSEDIANIICKYKDDLDTASDKLISLANDGGGSDNITAILIRL